MMTTVKKRIIAGAVGAASITAGFWLGGFDFDERGAGLVFWFVYTVGIAAFLSAFPFKDEE